MGLINEGTNCGLKHPFNKGNRQKCNNIKKCIASTCGSLWGLNPNIYESCKKRCQSNPEIIDPEVYMCEEIGADNLANLYGIKKCGYGEGEEAPNYLKNVIVIALVFVIIAGVVTIFSNSK